MVPVVPVIASGRVIILRLIAKFPRIISVIVFPFIHLPSVVVPISIHSILHVSLESVIYSKVKLKD